MLKAVSARIPHKTDAGGVVLGADTDAEVRDGWQAIQSSTAQWLVGRGEEVGLDGILVAPMLAPPLAELLIGARREPGLGVVLTVGAGGTWVEITRDVANRVLPVDERTIREMLDGLGVAPLLHGARGRPEADMDAVVGAVRAVADFVAAHPEVADAEVNPLFVYEAGAAAVDARVFLAGD